MIALLIVVGLLLWLMRRRAVRRRQLAGLDGAKPVFSVDPPRRRMGDRRRELL